MFVSLLAVAALQPSPRHILGDQPSTGSVSQFGFKVEWNEQGVSVSLADRVRWHMSEPLLYRPDYIAPSKSFVLVTGSDGKFHVTVVDRSIRVLCQLEIAQAAAGMPAVIPCGETLAFADPGVFARAPIAGENNPSWLDARQQLNVLDYAIKTGQLRWQKPELSIGQPLSASGAYLWTVRLVNPAPAYGGAKAEYEIEQVGVYSGKIVRSWSYPNAGVDLAAYRWRAEVKGTSCILHRLEPWPDATTEGNASPTEVTLAKIVASPKLKKRIRAKGHL